MLGHLPLPPVARELTRCPFYAWPRQLSMLKSRYFVNHDEHSPSEVHRFFETVHSCMRALNQVGGRHCWLQAVAESSMRGRGLRFRCMPPQPRCACLPGLQAGAPLQELALHTHVVGFGLYSDELSRLGPSLRRLHACALAEEEWFENDIWCEARLQECTALLDLRLTAFHLALQEAVRLPPSLTSLALGREVVSELGLGVPLPQLVSLGGLWAGQGCQGHGATLPMTIMALPCSKLLG